MWIKVSKLPVKSQIVNISGISLCSEYSICYFTAKAARLHLNARLRSKMKLYLWALKFDLHILCTQNIVFRHLKM